MWVYGIRENDRHWRVLSSRLRVLAMEDSANSTSEVDFGHGLRRKNRVCGFVVFTRRSRDGDQSAHPTLAGECRELTEGMK